VGGEGRGEAHPVEGHLGHAADLVGRLLHDRTAGVAAIFVIAGGGKALVSLAFSRSRVRQLDA